MSWDPNQYGRFADERTRPFHDLVSLLHPVERPRVVDLGCGTGELTRTLHLACGARETLGLDSSPEMLAKSGAFTAPGLDFALGDLSTFAPSAPVDVVFSNAALQWVPDHPALLARLADTLVPGGQLAVQVPANQDHPSHLLARAVAGEPPFADALRDQSVHVPGILAPEVYSELLDRLGFVEQHVRVQVYLHHLAGPEAVPEWTKGTLLTAWRRALSPELYGEFEARYRARVLAALPPDRPYRYAFKRLLFWGRKAA